MSMLCKSNSKDYSACVCLKPCTCKSGMNLLTRAIIEKKRKFRKFGNFTFLKFTERYRSRDWRDCWDCILCEYHRMWFYVAHFTANQSINTHGTHLVIIKNTDFLCWVVEFCLHLQEEKWLSHPGFPNGGTYAERGGPNPVCFRFNQV